MNVDQFLPSYKLPVRRSLNIAELKDTDGLSILPENER